MYSHLYNKYFSLSCDELSWFLFCEEDDYYKDTKRMIGKILKPCIQSINQSTSLLIEYTTQRCPIHTFEFHVTKKKIHPYIV